MFDIKSDVIKSLIELGVPEKDLYVSDNTKTVIILDVLDLLI